MSPRWNDFVDNFNCALCDNSFKPRDKLYGRPWVSLPNFPITRRHALKISQRSYSTRKAINSCFTQSPRQSQSMLRESRLLPLPDQLFTMSNSCKVLRNGKSNTIQSSFAPFFQYRECSNVNRVNELYQGTQELDDDDDDDNTRDFITAYQGSNSFFALGFNSGQVKLLNQDGHLVQTYHNHSSKISAVSLTQNGSYLATTSEDLQLFVYQCPCLQDNSSNVTIPVILVHMASYILLTHIALLPCFSPTPSTHMIACAGKDQSILLYSKQGFSWVTSLLCREHYPVIKFVWHPIFPLLLYVTYRYIRLFNVETQQLMKDVLFISGPHSLLQENWPLGESTHDDAVKILGRFTQQCFTDWISTTRFVVTVESFIMIADIFSRDRSNPSSSVTEKERNQLMFSMQLVCQLSMPYLICGLCVLHEVPAYFCFTRSIICLLTLDVLTKQQRDSRDISLRLLYHVLSESGDELTCDDVSIVVQSHASLVEPILVSCGKKGPNFILYGDRLLKADWVTLEDLSAWYLGNGDWYKALDIALVEHHVELVEKIMQTALEHFARLGQWDQAVTFLKYKGLSVETIKKLWNYLITLCEQQQALPSLLLLVDQLCRAQSTAMYCVLKSVIERVAALQPSILKHLFLHSFKNILEMSCWRRMIFHSLVRVMDVCCCKCEAWEESMKPCFVDFLLAKECCVFCLDTLRSCLDKPNKISKCLLECLALVLNKNNQVTEAIDLLLNLKGCDKTLFHILMMCYRTAPFVLQEIVLQRLNILFSYNPIRTATFLVYEHSSSLQSSRQRDLFPFSLITHRLQQRRYFLFCYLHQYFLVASEKVLLVQHQYFSLLVEFAPKEAFPFLQSLYQHNALISPEYALATCRRRKKELDDEISTPERSASLAYLYIAQVFLLFYLGHFERALTILLKKLKQVSMGIHLTLHINTPTLWIILFKRIRHNEISLNMLMEVLHQSHIPNHTVFMMTQWPRSFNSVDLLPPLFPCLSLIKTLPEATLEKLSSINLLFLEYFRQLNVQKRIHEYCLNASVKDLHMYRNAYLRYKKQGLPLLFCSCTSTQFSSRLQSTRSGGWLPFLSYVTQDIPQRNTYAVSPHESFVQGCTSKLNCSLIQRAAQHCVHDLSLKTNRTFPFNSNSFLFCVSKPSCCCLCFSPIQKDSSCIFLFSCGHVSHLFCSFQYKISCCPLCFQIQYSFL